MRLTVSIPCFGRPERTRRMINAICSQDTDGWEALIVGDCCPVIQGIIDTGEFKKAQEEQSKRGNILKIENLDKQHYGYGYFITNMNIQRATGKYLIFAANDDLILPNHLSNYLNGIESTDYDFMYFNSYVEPYGRNRVPELYDGLVGHSELIIRSSYAQKMPPHTAKYGHDWEFIKSLVNGGGTHARAKSDLATYIVKGVPVKREEGID
ncbi:MAG: glycosyltransferase family 2 protein [Bacteroidetes bacterium]|nr:glycosyltransferase family 2 protein [Bacteroidota bacterium]